jgi:hypothetical protein
MFSTLSSGESLGSVGLPGPGPDEGGGGAFIVNRPAFLTARP